MFQAVLGTCSAADRYSGKGVVTGKEAGFWYVYLGNAPGHLWDNTWCHECGELLTEPYVFDVLSNRITGNRCPACKAMVPGKSGSP